MGFRIRLPALIASLWMAAGVGTSGACSDRILIEERPPPEGVGEPACLWIAPVFGRRRDDVLEQIMDEGRERIGTVCLCLTETEHESLGEPSERDGWPEQGTVLEEFNELAYDECRFLAETHYEFVDDECLEFYESGRWLRYIEWATGDWASGKPPEFSCIDP